MTDKKKVDDFIDRVNKKYDSVVGFDGLRTKRFSTGSLELDIAIGGGYPRGKIVLIFGPQSSGKSVLVTKACASIEKYCSECRELRSSCVCGDFSGSFALLVEPEGVFDVDWAMKLGFNPEKHRVLRPDFGEQAVDVIDTAIREEVFDLIILDSIAMCVPSTEIEKSAADGVIGRHAMMMNRAFRKWQMALIKVKKKAPTLICVNQPREMIGVMYGDTLTLPGGKGQRFANSIELRLKPGKVHDVAGEATSAYVEISGSTSKNKTYPPKKEFDFHLALQDYENYRTGEVNDAEIIVKYGRQLGMIKKSKGEWVVEIDGDVLVSAPSREELVIKIHDTEDLKEIMYFKILKEKLI